VAVDFTNMNQSSLSIDEMLEMLNAKIKERFANMNQAFRMFDINNNGYLTINEFA
jgi:Ca2+-binding EF-hand superfamily protein